MGIYFHGEVQPQRKSRHFLMRALMTREIMRSRDAQCNTGNDLNADGNRKWAIFTFNLPSHHRIHFVKYLFPIGNE